MKTKTLNFFVISFLNSNQALASEPVGTPERVEFEYKLAFELHKDFSIEQLLNFADKEIKLLESKNELAFPHLFGSIYTVQNELKPFMFKDTYIDTADLDVLKAKSSYRLRYRWSDYNNYLKYKLLPFNSEYYPTRCEVQFKRDYTFNMETGGTATNESRFEYRNESEPFIDANDAPKAPWPEKDYIQYALQGKYLQHQMLPTAILRQAIKQESPILNPVVTVETIRYRTHLIANATPWGWGPNPGQIFIITFDYSNWTYADGSKNKRPTLEIEIEIDRNTMIMVENTQKIEPDNIINILAIQNSKKALNLLKNDQKVIKELLHTSIKKMQIGEQLDTNFKYARIMSQKGVP